MVDDMARTTKADLEKKVQELEAKVSQYLTMLTEQDMKYNELLEHKNLEFEQLPEYRQMQQVIERLEWIKKANEATIRHKEETERKLRNKIQELLEENNQLKDSAKNQAIINGSNARGAGRKPKSEDIIQQQIYELETYLSDNKTGKEISALMGISERTFYRLKSLSRKEDGKN